MVSNTPAVIVDENGTKYTQEQKLWLSDRRTKTQESWPATIRAFKRRFLDNSRSVNSLQKVYATISCHEKRQHHDYLKEETEWLLDRRQRPNESWSQTTAAHMEEFPFRPKTMRSLQMHWSRQRPQSKLLYHEWSLDQKSWLQQNSNNYTSWEATVEAFKEKFGLPDLSIAAIRKMSHRLDFAVAFSDSENRALMGMRPTVLTLEAALQLAYEFRTMCPQVERSTHDIIKQCYLLVQHRTMRDHSWPSEHVRQILSGLPHHHNIKKKTKKNSRLHLNHANCPGCGIPFAKTKSRIKTARKLQIDRGEQQYYCAKCFDVLKRGDNFEMSHGAIKSEKVQKVTFQLGKSIPGEA